MPPKSTNTSNTPNTPNSTNSSKTTPPRTNTTGKQRRTKSPTIAISSQSALDLVNSQLDTLDTPNTSQLKANSRHIAQVFNLPPINPTNSKEVEKRIKLYFNVCYKDDTFPTISELANALGVTRRSLIDWSRGKLRNCDSGVVARAIGTIEAFLERGMIDKSVNPIVGIFLLKNSHGYADSTPGDGEVAVDTEKSAEELIAESYLLPDEPPVEVIPTGDGDVE